MSINSETGFFYTELTVGTSAVVPCPYTSNGRRAARVFVSVETQAIRYRYDGGNPATDSGHSAAAGSSFSIDGPENVRQLRFIGQADSATLRITLEGQ